MIITELSHLQIRTNTTAKQPLPASHANHLCTYHKADAQIVKAAIKDAVLAQKEWEDMPWNDRAAIFLKIADLMAGKYRDQLLAATILGQGKNAWQAEIDVTEVRIGPFRQTFITDLLIVLVALRFLSLWS